jgi:hypothetical protein
MLLLVVKLIDFSTRAVQEKIISLLVSKYWQLGFA